MPSSKAKKKASFKSHSSGKRGEARVSITPKTAEPMAVKVMAWPTQKRAYRDATYRLVIDRPCLPSSE